MGFPQSVADVVLVKCSRHCCLCGKYAGQKMELHHIIQAADGGSDTVDNCIPLCLDCHAEVASYNPRHPKGRKYTAEELKGHRDKIYKKFEIASLDVLDEPPGTAEPSYQVSNPDCKTPHNPQMQKESNKHTVPYHFAMFVAILLCTIIAIWTSSSNSPRYTVSSPESRDLIQWKSIEDILCEGNLEKTALPLSTYNPSLNNGGHWNSNKFYSVSYPFTVQCSQLPVNPISAFISIRKKFFEQDTTSFDIDLEDVCIETEYYDRWCAYFHRMPDDPETEWEWSESGVNAFLLEVLGLASKFDDGFDLDDRFLSTIRSNEATTVHFSSKEQCYYVYFIYYGDYTSHLVCMYVRPDQETGTRIGDVEFQFLNTDYTIKGRKEFSSAERVLTNTIREQILSIIVSAEHLLAGTSGVENAIRAWNAFDSMFTVPEEYQIGDYQVAIQHKSYYATTRYDEELSTESCELIEYRIHTSAS